MNNEDKWRLVFREDMSLRFNRYKAYWAFGERFYGFSYYATKEELLEFFKDFAGIERSCRTILQEEEFALPVEAEAKRLSKAADFRKRLSKKDQQDFNKAFNENQ